MAAVEPSGRSLPSAVAANTTELLGPDKAQHCHTATGRQSRVPSRTAGEAGVGSWAGGGGRLPLLEGDREPLHS